MGSSTFDAADVTWTSSASGDPADAYYALLYNTTAGDRALLAIDLGGPASLLAGNISVTWAATGIMRHINQ